MSPTRLGGSDEEPLWERLARLVGLNPTQLKWRVRRWRQRAENEVRSVENRTRWVRYEHKTCGRCGHPADKDATVCTSCGAQLSGRLVGRLGRLFDSLAPQGASITYAAALLCVVLYVVMLQQDGWARFTSFTTPQLIRFGGLWNPLVQSDGQWWRLVSFNFVHIHILHIGMNLMALFDLGPMIEELYGRSRAIVLIVGTGLTAGLGTLIWYQPRFGYPVAPPTAGASGWIFGLIGAALVYGLMSGPSGRVLRSQMARWAVYGVLFGFFIQANNAAHIAGALGGGALALAMGTRPAQQLGRVERSFWRVLALAGVGLVIASFVLSALHTPSPREQIFRGGRSSVESSPAACSKGHRPC